MFANSRLCVAELRSKKSRIGSATSKISNCRYSIRFFFTKSFLRYLHFFSLCTHCDGDSCRKNVSSQNSNTDQCTSQESIASEVKGEVLFSRKRLVLRIHLIYLTWFFVILPKNANIRGKPSYIRVAGLPILTMIMSRPQDFKLTLQACMQRFLQLLVLVIRALLLYASCFVRQLDIKQR